jgi:DNA-binding MarR family transcriptional regulator
MGEDIKNQLDELKQLVHDIKLAISGDEDKGIQGIVQRQRRQEKRLKTVEYTVIGAIVILAVTNEVARDIVLSLLK